MFDHVKRKKSWLRANAEGLSNRLTRLIGAHFGESIPQYFVSEYPRSGGTWLSNMLADYLRCSRPGKSMLPIACRAVLHNHWSYHPKMRRVIYLMRDGRDVMVSYYFYRIRGIEIGMTPKARLFKQTFEKLFGPGYDPKDTATNLPKFMEYEFSNPIGAGRHNWPDHIVNWVGEGKETRPHVLYLTYEELLGDTYGAFQRALEHVSGEVAEDRLVRRTVDHFSMESITGRKSGEEDSSSFVRKGITGDWKNHFTREAAEVFDRYAGEALILAGYEDDHGWIEGVTRPDGAITRQAVATP